MEYTYGYRDNVIIPDKYNTGCHGELTSMADFFGSYYIAGSTMYITSSLQHDIRNAYEKIDFTNAYLKNIITSPLIPFSLSHHIQLVLLVQHQA